MSPSVPPTPAHVFAFLSHLCSQALFFSLPGTNPTLGHSVLTRAEASSRSWMLVLFGGSHGGQHRAVTSLVYSVFTVGFEAILQHLRGLALPGPSLLISDQRPRSLGCYCRSQW